MEDTSLKFGGWGLCRTRGRASAVKATENKKWMERKKTKNPAKRGVRKKKKNNIFFGRDGLWGDRPIDPFQMALRAALWTIATSGKALDDCKRTALVLYRNLVSTEVCTNNKKTVLLNVLLYCPGSTVPGYASGLYP